MATVKILIDADNLISNDRPINLTFQQAKYKFELLKIIIIIITIY